MVMLYLLFSLGSERYGVPASSIIEVVPYVSVRTLAGTTEGKLGVFQYRGLPVPVIDLRYLVQNRTCAFRLSTRIIVSDVPRMEGEVVRVGFLAEKVNQTAYVSPEQLQSRDEIGEFPDYFESLAIVEKTTVQFVNIERLVQDELRNLQ